MLRLLLDWAEKNAPENHPFFFMPNARWYCEALLRSQFLATSHRDKRGEGWTNADGCVGHFSIKNTSKGELALDPEARQFVVIEAKMFSGLSPGTTHAKKYDQAARNVACIAEVLAHAKRQAHELDRIAFAVVAPRSQIDRGVFGELVTGDHIRATVRDRVDGYGDKKIHWFEDCFLPTLEHIELMLVSWEDVLPTTNAPLLDFYQRCIKYNAPAASSMG